MRARRVSGWEARRSRTSEISGACEIAGFCRSLRQVLSQLARAFMLSNSSGISGNGVLFFFSSAWKMAGVETSINGLTRTIAPDGRSVSGSMISPMPRMRAGFSSRHIGTSAPRLRASLARSVGEGDTPQILVSARRVAAASADPPPMPAATGSDFSSSI